jgi:hypothetical protein
VLINITGGKDTSILDINEAAQQITQSADPEANIIFGAGIDESLKDEVRVTVIATGFEKTPFVSIKPTVTPSLDNDRPTERPVTQSEAARPVAEQRSSINDGLQVPSFVNESRFVMPNREERPQSVQPSEPVYTERPSSYAPIQQQPRYNAPAAPVQREESVFEDDPFADVPAKPARPAQPRRGFTPDIPPFLRNRRK